MCVSVCVCVVSLLLFLAFVDVCGFYVIRDDALAVVTDLSFTSPLSSPFLCYAASEDIAFWGVEVLSWLLAFFLCITVHAS